MISKRLFFSVFIIFLSNSPPALSLLYPKDTETREVKSLNGIWDFKLSSASYLHPYVILPKPNLTIKSIIAKLDGDAIPMPVPASYNDITQDKSIRDHVGPVIYERKFRVPSSWQDGRRIVLRFGSVCYSAIVWVNGQYATSHEIGHLPFEVEINSLLDFTGENVLTVTVDNTLTETTVPQGSISELDLGNNQTEIQQTYTFDFFNYAGIDRPVYLYTTPKLFIDDIVVKTTVSNDLNSATVEYKVNVGGETGERVIYEVTLFDGDTPVVSASDGPTGVLTVNNPKLWYPYLSSNTPGYLYTLKVSISYQSGLVDIYRESIGIRSITWDSSSLKVNGQPVYIRGVGKHEDSDIRGKGLDLALITKDFNLIKWMGINAFRTSHYPYAEEIMDFADREGIMIIDECPSVNTDLFSADLKIKHQQSLTELINRDKNRPSVIIWSVANEPRTQSVLSGPYFKDIVDHVKTLDTSRPTTIAQATAPAQDYSAQYLDIVSYNRYNAWYSDAGKTEVITNKMINEAQAWRDKHNKPVLVTEYGADAMVGLHNSPEFLWSEEYQVVSFEENFKAFDELRTRGYFIGEMIWNFADFMTGQGINRVVGNRKGLLTRQRQPKSVAYLARKRYFELANQLHGTSLPTDLYEYVIRKS